MAGVSDEGAEPAACRPLGAGTGACGAGASAVGAWCVRSAGFPVRDTPAVFHDPSATLPCVTPPRPVTVAFCPQPPLLLPAVAGAPSPALSMLRAAVSAAVQAVLAIRPEVVI